MFEIYISGNLVSTSDEILTLSTTALHSLSFKTHFQEIPEYAVIELKEGETRRFIGRVATTTETDGGLMAVRAYGEHRILKKQRTELSFENLDGGYIIKKLLEPYPDWCDTTEIASDLGNISLNPCGNTIWDAVQEVMEWLGLVGFWDMTDGKFRVYPRGDRALIEPLPLAYAKEIFWTADETEIWNRLKLHGGDGLYYAIEGSEESHSFLTWGRCEMKPITKTSVTNITVAFKYLSALYQYYSERHYTTTCKGVAYSDTLIQALGYTIPITGTNHDGSYYISEITINYNTGLIDIVMGDRFQDLLAQITSLEKQLTLVQQNETPETP